MGLDKPKRIRPRDQIVSHHVEDIEAADRLTDELARVLDSVDQAKRSGVRVDLVVGTNRILHLLGRTPKGCNITPTVADATFAWCLASKDDNVATITVVGVDQPGVWVEFY